jgi:hypothetical protein
MDIGLLKHELGIGDSWLCGFEAGIYFPDFGCFLG